MALQINGNYGINRGIRARTKILFLNVRDVVAFGICMLPSIQFGGSFPHSQIAQMLAFYIVNFYFSFYMVHHPLTNPGKNMFELIWANLSKRRTIFNSIDRYQDRKGGQRHS